MTWFDWGVVAIIGLSLTLGLMRGFIREIFALVGWLAASLVAMMYAATVGATVARFIPDLALGEQARWLVGFVIIFLTVLIVTGFVALAIRRVLHAAGLGLSDRLLGAGFGLARGLIILVIAVLLASLTPLREQSFWSEAKFSRP